MGSGVSTLDFIIIGIYFLLVFGIGFYFSRREKTSAEYFLAGRSVFWWAIGASLFASNISSEHFVGLAGSGAATGLAVAHYELWACFCVMALGWIFTPFYIRSGVFTTPEFLERRYGPACRWYLTTISIIAYVLTKVSVTLIAGSLLLEKVVGWDYQTSSLVMIIATGIYTVAGGLSAVIYTEVLQTVILIGGAILLTIIGIFKIGGVSELVTRIDPEHFNMFKPVDHPDFPWTGMMFAAPILGVWYWCTDQFIVQRTLSAANIDQAQRGTIFAGYLKLLPLFIMVVPGMVALVLYPEIAQDSNSAYPTLVTQLLPSGLKGIVIAGLLAAIMSSLASCFNSCSTLITMDVYKHFKPDASERSLVNAGRFCTGIIVILGFLWIPYIEILNDKLYVYLQAVQAYISPPIAACFLFGIIFARLNSVGAISSLLCGFVLGAARFVLEIFHKKGHALPSAVEWFTTINFMHFALFLFIVCSVVLFAVSLATAAPSAEQVKGLTFSTVEKTETVSDEHRKDRRINMILSIILAIIVISLWITFS